MKPQPTRAFPAARNFDPLLIAVAKTDDAEAARFGDRLCQCSTGRSSHRGKKNRMGDAELFGELCAKRHRVCPFYLAVCNRCSTRQHPWGLPGRKSSATRRCRSWPSLHGADARWKQGPTWSSPVPREAPPSCWLCHAGLCLPSRRTVPHECFSRSSCSSNVVDFV
jgi:hypothetical protein